MNAIGATTEYSFHEEKPIFIHYKEDTIMGFFPKKQIMDIIDGAILSLEQKAAESLEEKDEFVAEIYSRMAAGARSARNAYGSVR